MAVASDTNTFPTSGVSITNGNITKGEEIKRLAATTEKWSEAQAKVARIAGIATTMKTVEGSYLLCDRRKKRSYSRRGSSVTVTPARKQKYDQRVLIPEEFEDAVIVDPVELANTSGDILSDAAIESMHAQARLRDKYSLTALVAPVLSKGNGKYDNQGDTAGTEPTH